MLALAENQDI